MQGEIQKYQKKELKTNIYFLDVITLHMLSQKTSGWLLLNLYFNNRPLINGKSASDWNTLLSRPLWIILPLWKSIEFIMEKLEQIISIYQQIIQKA